LLGLGRVPLGPFVGLDYEGFGFIFGDFHIRYVPIEFAGVLSYELVTFPDLNRELVGCLAMR
jgi:hypothetical protein